MNYNIEILVKGIGKLDITTKDSDNFGIPLTFNLSDIKDIGSRKASFSKTIKVLGTKNNNLIFDQLYEIKGQDFSFKMTEKHNCVLLVNKNPIIDGFLVLKTIDKLLIGNKYEVVYNIVIFDEVKNFFDDLDGKLMSDLDFSAPFTYSGDTWINYEIGDHTLTPNNIVEIYDTNADYKSVYTYPLVDFGYNISSGGTNFPYDNTVGSSVIYPAVYQKAIIDKIFTDAGYTYDSDYFESISYSGFFGSMLNLYNKSVEFVNTNYCEYTTDGSVVIPSTPDWNYYNIALGRNACSMNSVWTNYYEYDPEYIITKEIVTGSTSENAKGITITEKGDYKIIFRIDVIEDRSGTFADTGIAYPTDGYYPPRGATLGLPIPPSTYDIKKWSADDEQITIIKRFLPDDMKNQLYTGKTSQDYAWYFEGEIDVELKEGDFVYLRIQNGRISNWIGVGNTWAPNESASVSMNGTSLEMIKTKELIEDYDLPFGTDPDIKINKILPDMTQAEFVRQHIKMANLYIWSNKEDAKRLFIEPRDDFYKQGEILDWSEKVDYNNKITIKSLNDKIANNIKFEYELGDDFYSNQYNDANDQTYGTKELNLQNPYLKEDQLVKLKYQSYLMGNSGSFVFPKLYDKEDPENTNWFNERNTFKPLVAFNVNDNIPVKMAGYTNGGVRNKITTRSSWASHAKIMGGWSFDLNYETTGETFTLSGYDNERGLYKVFWENYINNIIDDDARIVEMYLNLSLTDILNLDFRNRIDIDGQRYFLQKVEYDPTRKASSKTTLLKIIDTISEGSFDTWYLLKNDSGDYVLTDNTDKIIIN